MIETFKNSITIIMSVRKLVKIPNISTSDPLHRRELDTACTHKSFMSNVAVTQLIIK